MTVEEQAYEDLMKTMGEMFAIINKWIDLDLARIAGEMTHEEQVQAYSKFLAVPAFLAYTALSAVPGTLDKYIDEGMDYFEEVRQSLSLSE